MSLEDCGVVDAVGVDKVTDEIVLSIVDSWNWTSEHQHLEALQRKLNSYFDFIQSGQIYEVYPDAAGKRLRVEVAGKYPITSAAVEFLNKASLIGSALNIIVAHRTVEA